MLVRLTSSSSGEMIMFAEHARALFDIIGKTGTARGVFTTEQLPDAITRLKQAVDEEKRAEQELAAQQRGAEENDPDEHEDKERQSEARHIVALRQRAVPLIHLMEWTLREEGFIVWEAARDF